MRSGRRRRGGHLKQILDSLSQQNTLQLLAYADIQLFHLAERKAKLEQARSMLQHRLTQLMSNTPEPIGSLLTVPAVAKVLKLGKARTYELLRSGAIPSVLIGARRKRVRRADLAKYLQPHNGRV